MEQRTCRVCGKTFKPRAANQVYCTGARGKCYRRAMNAKQRGRPLVHGEVGLPFDCAHCSKPCVPGENVAPHATKFCGKTCKAAWHKANTEGPKLRREARRQRARRKLARAAAGTPSTVQAWIAGDCIVCGVPFVAHAHPVWPSRHCSDACMRRTSRRNRAAKYGWNESERKRCREHGLAYERINRPSVFRRDAYRCGICGEQTDPTMKVPHPRAPTIDHIVPISQGGPHLYSNVQCACFECNCRKGASITAQLAFAA